MARSRDDWFRFTDELRSMSINSLELASDRIEAKHLLYLAADEIEGFLKRSGIVRNNVVVGGSALDIAASGCSSLNLSTKSISPAPPDYWNTPPDYWNWPQH